MVALPARTERSNRSRFAEAAPKGPRPAAAVRSTARARHENSWNVLAEELVAFPSAGPAPSYPSVHRPDVTRRRPCARTVPAAAPLGVHPDLLVSERRQQITPRTRGLRRLLPGAATLAVLAGVWLGAGALSGLHRPAIVVPAGAVKIAGGYRYVARPGDTLWSIAARLEPGGDPRILVADFEQQLHGAQLMPGDKLDLP